MFNFEQKTKPKTKKKTKRHLYREKLHAERIYNQNEKKYNKEFEFAMSMRKDD